jgi:hypothetical protein
MDVQEIKKQSAFDVFMFAILVLGWYPFLMMFLYAGSKKFYSPIDILLFNTMPRNGFSAVVYWKAFLDNVMILFFPYIIYLAVRLVLSWINTFQEAITEIRGR